VVRHFVCLKYAAPHGFAVKCLFIPFQINMTMSAATSPEYTPNFPPPWDYVFALSSRIVVWGLLFGILYVLSSFFLLIFLTFIFAYIQESGVYRLKPYLKKRILRVIIVMSLLLGALTSTGFYLVPQVINQAQGFARQFSTYTAKIDEVLLEIANKFPPLYDAIPELKNLRDRNTLVETNDKAISPTVSVAGKILGTLLDSGDTPNTETSNQQNIKVLIDKLKNVSNYVFSITSAFLLSLLFSFLIVLDLPNLSASVANLANTKLRFIYIEVADSILDFSRVLGESFEAQLFIGMVNTFLTAIGLYAMGMGEHIAFLSVIVFFCSFIPVAGFILSSIPIFLVSLQTGGLQLMSVAAVFIVIIHFIEGYILNPNIYGARLHINPVIVLIILTLGGKLFHFWGLLLGVPVCTYVFGHAIRYKNPLIFERGSP
jgi:predicted PurR-regulated permease PerM